MENFHFDIAIIGSGPAGHSAAIKLATFGRKIVIIEKDIVNMLGGTCLNQGCIPVKSMLHYSSLLSSLKKSGLNVDLSFLPDISFVSQKKRENIKELLAGLSYIFKKNNITILSGTAKFLSNSKVEIINHENISTTITADKFIIATGSYPSGMKNFLYDHNKIIDSNDAINLTRVPKTMLIAGAGAIGLEFADFFNTFGTKITIIDIAPRALSAADKEISRFIEKTLKEQGIEFLPKCFIENIDSQDNEIKAVLNYNGEIKNSRYEKILIAAGRYPNTKNLGLENTGVMTDEKGFIKVDNFMRTSAPNIYAGGDVIATPMLAHTASAEGELIARVICLDTEDSIDYSSIPNVIYSRVKIAYLGKSEEILKEENVEYKQAKYFFKANGRSVANLEREGFIKLIVSARDKKILGVHIAGNIADELINIFALAKQNGLTAQDISETIYAHPTVSEVCKDVASVL
ncbi:dihydrolipoyl dehydrogenase [Candidatus Omnitrophus magneticus]|uniref:Dihydrolipoyl dehydrogenase n=1 Tax=Candidatus Omnitrophus magneticus TaxID=1609969 RepID=A0A0F0CJ11_9BACT|nr:dihydrolipoyl dehydrogenase [Candidatus Omnitrophus magneticus]